MLCNIDNNPRLLDGFLVIFVWNPRVSLLIFQDHYLLVIYFNSSPVTFFLLSSLGIDFNASLLLLVNVVRLKPPFAHNSLTFLITSLPSVTVWKLFSMSSTWKFLSEIFVMPGAYSVIYHLQSSLGQNWDMMTTMPTKLMWCHLEFNDLFFDITIIPLQESMEIALIIKDLYLMKHCFYFPHYCHLSLSEPK